MNSLSYEQSSPPQREFRQEFKIEQILFSSEKKPQRDEEGDEDMLNMSSQHSPSMREIQGSSMSIRDEIPHRYSRATKHNWRQMLTPHQMNDITATNMDYQTNHNISRPSQSPDVRAILGTDNSIKLGTDTTQQFKTQDFSEKALELQTFSTEERKDTLNSDHMQSGKKTHLMSMNSNLKSMLGQTIKENELNFFKELEQKYFKMAVKKDSSSPSLQHQEGQRDIIEEQLDHLTVQESVSSMQQSQSQTRRTAIEDHFLNFRQKQSSQLQRQSDINSRGNVNSFNPGQSQMLSDFSLSPQRLTRQQSSSFLHQTSPPLTSQNLLNSESTAREDLKESLNLFKLRLEAIQRQQEEKERRISDIHSPVEDECGYTEDDQNLDSDNEILNTYRVNCEIARQKFHQTFQNTLGSKNSTLRNDSQHLIILNKSDNSSNNTPDVYQTAKWNQTASIADSFQDTLKMKLLSHNTTSQAPSQKNLLSPSKDDEQLLQTSQRGRGNIYLYEENHELKSYLKKAYQCVVKFLNQQDIAEMNPDLAQELQVFAELEQQKKEWLIESHDARHFYHQSTPEQQDQQQYQEVYQIQQASDDTQCSSIQTNLSGIKANLKETKKSLLQAKKLLFQEKCINIDHEKQIQELKQQMVSIQSQIKLIESNAMNPSQMVSYNHKSPDPKQQQYHYLSGFKSPNTAIQTTQCSNCCSKNQQSKGYQISPIMMGALSTNTQQIKGGNKPQSSNKFDSFITEESFTEDQHVKPQREEYSFLQDEAELLKSSRTNQQRGSQQSSPSHIDLSRKVAELESWNEKLRKQLEENTEAFLKVKEELESKDEEIKRYKLQEERRSQKIAELNNQLHQTKHSLKSLLDNQKEQEDLMLEHMQKHNSTEEELRIVKQHLNNCKAQLEYFKNKNESFSKQESLGSTQHIQSAQGIRVIFPDALGMKRQQNDHFSSKDTEKRENDLEGCLQTERRGQNFLSTTQKFGKAGTIHHQKRNTASFNSPSDSQREAEQLYLECDSNFQSERVQKFHEMREKLTQQFGRIGSLIEQESQQDFDYLRNDDYYTNQQSRIEVNSNMRVLSTADLELFNSITYNKGHKKNDNFKPDERGFDCSLSYRKSPTVIIHEEEDGSLKNIECRLQSSSILKYSGDTFILPGVLIKNEKTILRGFQGKNKDLASLTLQLRVSAAFLSSRNPISKIFWKLIQSLLTKRLLVRLTFINFDQGGQPQATDFKRCIIEISLVGQIIDNLKRSDGFQYELKIGEELVAKWFEPKGHPSPGLIKKVRFPFKFKFLNANISIEVNPIPDEKTIQEMVKKNIEVLDYTIYHGLFSFNQVLKNQAVLTPAFTVPAQLEYSNNSLQLGMIEHKDTQHVTIKFYIQLAKDLSHLLDEEKYNIKIIEDNGFYFSKVKLESIEKMNSQAVALNLCIPHYEEKAFKDRQFSINFEEKNDQRSFITPMIYIKGQLKIKGSDFHKIEEMQEKMTPQDKEEMKSLFKVRTEEVKEGEEKFEVIEESNPYLRVPRVDKVVYSADMQELGRAMVFGPIQSQSYLSLIDFLNQSQLQVVPIIAMDFSLANLTFLDDQCLHSTKQDKPNDYRDIFKMIADSYKNILNIPVLGYSAKTTKTSTKSAPIFPVSQDLRNPFITNDPEIIDECYTKCLKDLELSTPINLLPLFSFIKKLGLNIKSLIKENNGRIDCFYVVYILSAGLIDDLPDLLESLDLEWEGLPVQLHLINLSATNIVNEDLDTIKFQDFTMKYNLQSSCWLQFNVHFYDRIKSKYGHRSANALNQLKETAIESVPKEIETYLFLNQLKPNKFAYKGEAVQQSLINVITLTEAMAEELYSKGEEMGIDKALIETMINQHRLFEWNIDTLQALMSNQNTNSEEKQERKRIM